MDPLTAVTFGTKLVGSILGGRSKKKAAKRKYKMAVERIVRRSDQLQEDLLLQTNELTSAMQATMGATGARTTSASFSELRENESFKFNQRRERILQGEKDAIQDAARERKATRYAANLEMGLGIADAVASGGGADFFGYIEQGAGKIKNFLGGNSMSGGSIGGGYLPTSGGSMTSPFNSPMENRFQ